MKRRELLAAVAAGSAAGLAGCSTLSNTRRRVSGSVPHAVVQDVLRLPAGTYAWDGTPFTVDRSGALVGTGAKGDVVWRLNEGTMAGSVTGRLANVVVRGRNHESKAGVDLHPGATVEGFVWPDGGQRSQDRAFYTPSGGTERVTVRHSAWASNVNNGAYADKPPTTFEHCVAANNNIAGIRVGHRDGTPAAATSHVRNCLVAVTRDVEHGPTNDPNARGVRIRHDGNFVIDGCWFVYRDVSGASSPIEIHESVPDATVTVRNCAFYNDSGEPLVRDKTDGAADVTVTDCTVTGAGSRRIEGATSGVTTARSVSVPSPKSITGYAAANDIAGIGPGVGPWTRSDFRG